MPLDLSRVLFWGPDRTSDGRPLSTWIVVVPSFCSVSCYTGSSQPTVTVFQPNEHVESVAEPAGERMHSAKQEKRNVKRKRNHLDPVMVASTISPFSAVSFFFFFSFSSDSFD